jgi:hypothetical protein
MAFALALATAFSHPTMASAIDDLGMILFLSFVSGYAASTQLTGEVDQRHVDALVARALQGESHLIRGDSEDDGLAVSRRQIGDLRGVLRPGARLAEFARAGQRVAARRRRLPSPLRGSRDFGVFLPWGSRPRLQTGSANCLTFTQHLRYLFTTEESFQ